MSKTVVVNPVSCYSSLTNTNVIRGCSCLSPTGIIYRITLPGFYRNDFGDRLRTPSLGFRIIRGNGHE